MAMVRPPAPSLAHYAGRTERGDLLGGVADFLEHEIGVFAESRYERLGSRTRVRKPKRRIQRAKRAAGVVHGRKRLPVRELRVLHRVLDRAVGRAWYRVAIESGL